MCCYRCSTQPIAGRVCKETPEGVPVLGASSLSILEPNLINHLFGFICLFVIVASAHREILGHVEWLNQIDQKLPNTFTLTCNKLSTSPLPRSTTPISLLNSH